MTSQKRITFLLAADAVKLSKVLSKDFLEIEVYAISEGENRNNYSFLLSAMENSLSTCNDKPVLAYYNPFTKGIEEHNCTISRDFDTGEDFYDYTSPNSERPVGVITPNSAKIVDYQGKNWIKFKAKLWVKYNRQLVKNLLKAKSSKVSVEIDVLESYTDEEGIEVIEKFVLDGVTILQFIPNTTVPIREGIPGAKLDLGEFVNSANFKEFKHKMAFAMSSQSLEENEGNSELKYAKKERIIINNSKEAAIMEGDWEKPQADFYDWLREASNFKALSKENALILEEGWETNISANKYPHHSRKNNELVVNQRGVIAAYSRGMAQKIFENNPNARKHIMKHFKELGLNTDEMFAKDIFASKENFKEGKKVLDKIVNSLENNNKEREGKNKMFYETKMELIREYLIKTLCQGEEKDCHGLWVCDLSDDEAIYRFWTEEAGEKYFKAYYKIEDLEDEIKVFVDTEKAVEVEREWIKKEEKKIVYEEKEYTIEEIGEIMEDYARIKESFSEMEESNKALESEKVELSEKFAALSRDHEELKMASGELEIKIKQFEKEAEEREIEDFKICGCDMVDKEDILDDEEDEEVKNSLKALIAQYCDEKKFESKEDMCNFVSDELRKLVYDKVKKAKASSQAEGAVYRAQIAAAAATTSDAEKDCYSFLSTYNNI